MKSSPKLPPQLVAVLKQLARYRVVIVVFAVVALYGYLFMQVNAAVSAGLSAP